MLENTFKAFNLDVDLGLEIGFLLIVTAWLRLALLPRSKEEVQIRSSHVLLVLQVQVQQLHPTFLHMDDELVSCSGCHLRPGVGIQ